ncbi:UDP-N-acetylmuramoyl-L-alanyl-D-glutamate--2,6-diaminopimelate ligase [Thalassotalea maritima]|uniref:UDP-N-acetylmuramoyl-L-alanyl-D-glutamate--2, 6-diaminopimelate ligase n=1 Tax=Thalassotalea maritima TaxID=3242416 RepID=UPI0035299719
MTKRKLLKLMVKEAMVPNFSINKTLANFAINLAATGFDDSRCGNLVNDSRQVQANDVFAAIVGTQQDASQFITAAIAQGASVVIRQCDEASMHGHVEYQQSNRAPVPVVSFYQLADKLHQVSAHYYQMPSNDLTMIGVTGTNGKTSCCHLLAQLFTANQAKSAIIGTLGAGPLDDLQDVNNTTPGPTLLQQLLLGFKQQGISNVAMEVSSHALAQKRLDANMIDIAVFTNLSRDHLDYHGDMQSYARAKQKLFVKNSDQRWVINGDDAVGRQWLEQDDVCNDTLVYGLEQSISALPAKLYVCADNVKCHQAGISFNVHSSFGHCHIDSSLLGKFNVSNLLAVISVALSSGVGIDEMPSLVQQLQSVAGRMELFSAHGKASAVVDYAHTPDGLEQALRSARQHCQGKLWVVFGCGGDRDKGKRPMMGAIAEQFADHIVLTNDNPRSESAEQITDDIAAGIKDLSNTQVIIDRQQAVLTTLAKANAKDMVLLAGKGHEDYLIIGEQTIAYNEREVVRQFYTQGDAR